MMGWSAWKIWLHPKVARRVMEDLELAAQTAVGAEADSSARLQEACLEIASLRSEADDARQHCDRLAETNGQLEKEKEALTRRVSELSDELAAAKEELLERLDVETQVKEFESMLTKVEQMKAGYERRIERLRHALASARRASGHADSPSSELMEIDMTAPGAAATDAASAPRPAPSSAASDTATAASDPTISDTDWLMSLPD